MCAPILAAGAAASSWLAPVAIGLTAASGIVSAKSQIDAGNYAAKVAENNAKVADIRAQEELRKGAQEDLQQRWKIRALAGKQATAIGANNVVGSTGTALDILGETAMFGEVDLNTIRNNAARASWGHKVEASNLRAEAKASKYQGRMGAFGTLLSTGSQVAGMWGKLPFKSVSPATKAGGYSSGIGGGIYKTALGGT